MHLCDVLGNCLLLRGPGRDVTGDWPAPTGGRVRGQKWGGGVTVSIRAMKEWRMIKTFEGFEHPEVRDRVRIV